ncbi:MAG: threonine aldolase family protein [Bacillus sp. (in: firmicutes)]
MYSFKNDYSEGAHPDILRALAESNFTQEEGYGYDSFTKEAIRLLKEKIQNEDIDIHLLSGGTQTNLIAISAFLRPHQAVIAPHTGHIFVNEAGAIEATGHKVITVPATEGKLKPEQIEEVLALHRDEHTVRPKMVYISNPTELGTIYKKQELQELKAVCEHHHLYLYVDGARLGMAMASTENDMTLAEFASLTDAFYIGATKAGALLGEALVICSDVLKEDFRYHMKQKGALLAKSRLLGIQFVELFKGHLFYDMADHANEMAGLLQKGLKRAGAGFLAKTSTNQVFPILPNDVIEELQKDYSFYIWQTVDKGHSAIRLITSWATQEKMVETFLRDVTNLMCRSEVTKKAIK